MRFLMILCALLITSFSAHAAPKFPAWNDFAEYDGDQMRGMPDVKASAAKAIKEADAKKMPEVQIILLKNSIYAQHGYKFTDRVLANYFFSRPWYHAGKFKESMLNKIEKANAKLLRKVIAARFPNHKNPTSPGDGYEGEGYEGGGYNGGGYEGGGYEGEGYEET